MNSEHLVDPEIIPFLDFLPSMDLGVDDLPGIRDAMTQMFAATPLPEGLAVTVETVMIPGSTDAPEVRVVVYRPTDVEGVLPAILHIHGGGYYIGSPEMMDASNREWTADLGCVFVSVDYRLAPETRFPGAVEDCYAALAWMHGNAGTLGIDKARIGVKGESAGGGLAAGLALLARDRGELPLAFQHLTYPMIDDRTCVHPDPHPFTGEYVWTPKGNLFGWTALLGVAPGSEGVSPYAAAARAEDLAKLPPTYIAVGALDLFLEEDLDYARRLMRAGVPVELHVYPGAFHGFDAAATSRVALSSTRDASEALRRALHG